MKKDLKLFEVRGDIYYVAEWRRNNPDFMGPPNWYEVWGGWFWYEIIAVSEDDALKGAIEYHNRFSPPMNYRDEECFFFRKPRLIEWISYITEEAAKSIQQK